MTPIRDSASFEFIVPLDTFEDLDWWSHQRGDVDYWCDYEYMRLHIRVRLADLR